MENESSSCGVCSRRYDTKEHSPRVLLGCGHTLCYSCLREILNTSNVRKCPFDNLTFNEAQNSLKHFPLNFALMNLLEGKNKKVCQTHGEELAILCLQCRVKVCSDCALFGQHKGHGIKKVKELRAKGIKLKKELEQSLIRFEKNRLEKDQDAEAVKKGFFAQMGNKFDEIKMMLKTKEGDCRKQMESLFRRTSDSNSEASLKIEAEKALEEIDQACQKDENLALLDRDFSSIISRLQPQIPKEQASKLAEQTSRMMNCIESFLTNQVNSIKSFELLDDDKGRPEPEPEQPQQQIPSKNSVERAPQNPWKKVNTMLTVERFEETLLVQIKYPNRIDRLVNIGGSRFIERIKMIFGQYNSFFQGSTDLNFLSFLLQHFDYYTSLKVVFTPLGLNTHHAVTLFNLVFFRIQHLTEIEICLEGCKITIDEPVLFFCNNILPKANSLRSLILNLGFTLLTDKSLFVLAKSLSPLRRNLSIFTLGVEYAQITDDGIERLLNTIEGVKALRLYLAGTRITDRSLKLLGEKVMPRLKGLEKFSLDASETKITMEGVNAIFTGVPKDISRLSLSFEGIKLSDQVVSLFEEKVCPKLELVEDLHLRLEGNDLKAKAGRVLERVRKEAEERRKARECKQENHR